MNHIASPSTMNCNVTPIVMITHEWKMETWSSRQFLRNIKTDDTLLQGWELNVTQEVHFFAEDLRCEQNCQKEITCSTTHWNIYWKSTRWPAFWLLPTHYHYGKGWPRSGEIDIMEYRGQETSQISSAIHYGYPKSTTNTGPMSFPGVDFSKDYHIFAFEWDDKKMRWFMDNKTTFVVDSNKYPNK